MTKHSSEGKRNTLGTVFKNTTLLTKIDLSYFVGVTTIGNISLAYNTRCQCIILPSGITSISNHVFRDNDAQTSLVVLAVTPPTYIGSSNYTPFSNSYVGSTKCYIYVPDDSVDAYKAATEWSSKASYIKPLSQFPGSIAYTS